MKDEAHQGGTLHYRVGRTDTGNDAGGYNCYSGHHEKDGVGSGCPAERENFSSINLNPATLTFPIGMRQINLTF
jgi:hypothetical protein